MVQTYVAVNVDKREMLAPFDYGCGMYLMSFSYIDDKLIGNKFTNALHALMQTSWEGDRVYLVGNCAGINRMTSDLGCMSAWFSTLDSLKREFVMTKDDTFYDFAKNFKPAIPSEKKERLRYIYNTKRKEYIDLKTLPVQEEGTYGNRSVFIDPLPLLICMGNGSGEGDYYDTNKEYVGKWVSTSQHIFFSDELFDGYTEFRPEFKEEH